MTRRTFPCPMCGRRSDQCGQAMITVAVLMLLVVAGAIFTTATSGISALANRQADDTTRAMAQVKEAMIGWSAARTPTAGSPNIRPGELPCPDNDNSGTDAGACVAGAIGRVPWRSLGIPEPRDSTGEILWYAIAGPFRNHNMSSAPITSDTLGNLTVYQDSSAVTVTSQAVAVIFAPGSALGTQDRSAIAALCSTTGTTIARNLCAANYLESTGGGDNAQTSGPFIQAPKSGTFNDRVLAITNADLMPLVERRVAREMISILQQYKTATGTSVLAALLPGFGVYPWADRSDGGSNDWNHNRFPCGTALPVNWNTLVPFSLSLARTPALPNWLTNGCTNPVTGWTSVIYYGVARNKLELSGAACSNCTDATLTVTNASSRAADLCAAAGTTCTSSVVATGSADVILITAGAATANPRGNWPAADFSAITGYFEDAENSENQGINSDRYVVPSSTSHDRDRIFIIR